jgi:hypothetical protein
VEFKPVRHVIMDRFDKSFPRRTCPSLDRGDLVRLFKDAGSQLLAFERGEIDMQPGLDPTRGERRSGRASCRGVQIAEGAAPAIWSA